MSNCIPIYGELLPLTVVSKNKNKNVHFNQLKFKKNFFVKEKSLLNITFDSTAFGNIWTTLTSLTTMIFKKKTNLLERNNIPNLKVIYKARALISVYRFFVCHTLAMIYCFFIFFPPRYWKKCTDLIKDLFDYLSDGSAIDEEWINSTLDDVAAMIDNVYSLEEDTNGKEWYESFKNVYFILFYFTIVIYISTFLKSLLIVKVGKSQLQRICIMQQIFERCCRKCFCKSGKTSNLQRIFCCKSKSSWSILWQHVKLCCMLLV